MSSSVAGPTGLAISWIEVVARTAADMPVGRFGVAHFGIVALGSLVAFHRRRIVRYPGRVLMASAVAAPLLLSPSLAGGHHHLVDGVELVRSSAGHDVVILERSGGVESVLESLRVARVGRIDLLVSRRGDRGAGAVVRAVRTRFAVVEIWAPPMHNIPGARVRPVEGGRLGSLQLVVGPDGDVAVTERTDWRG